MIRIDIRLQAIRMPHSVYTVLIMGRTRLNLLSSGQLVKPHMEKSSIVMLLAFLISTIEELEVAFEDEEDKSGLRTSELRKLPVI